MNDAVSTHDQCKEDPEVLLSEKQRLVHAIRKPLRYVPLLEYHGAKDFKWRS